MATRAEPVCTEPKVFVGQLPMEATRDQVVAVFERYGTIKKCNLITGHDGRSKGCAMVLYEKWAQAEAAVAHENGTTNFGATRPLVVKFADPPKRTDGPVTGIAPKKLFVGQVPADTSEEDITSWFSPYGVLQDVHMLKKGNAPGCAFVTYETWSQAEAAIEAMHGTNTMGASVALVVKFADAKVGDVKVGEKRGMGGGEAPSSSNKRPFNAGNTPAGGPGNYGMQPGFGSYGMMGMGGYGDMGMGMGYGMGMGMGPMAGNMGGGMNGMGMGAMGKPGMMQGRMGMGMGMQGMGMGMGGMAGAGWGNTPGNMGGGMGGNMAGGMGGGMGGSAPQLGDGKLGTGLKNDAAKQWKLFVGQVPFEASAEDLWPIFSQIGEVYELVVLKNPSTGKSKGCAFVTFASDALAQQAIMQLNGQSVLGRDKALVVKYANQK